MKNASRRREKIRSKIFSILTKTKTKKKNAENEQPNRVRINFWTCSLRPYNISFRAIICAMVFFLYFSFLSDRESTIWFRPLLNQNIWKSTPNRYSHQCPQLRRWSWSRKKKHDTNIRLAVFRIGFHIFWANPRTLRHVNTFFFFFLLSVQFFPRWVLCRCTFQHIMSSCDAHSFLFHTKHGSACDFRQAKRCTFNGVCERARTFAQTNGCRTGRLTAQITIAHFWQFKCGSSEVTRYTHTHTLTFPHRLLAAAAVVEDEKRAFPNRRVFFFFLWCDFIWSCLVMTSRCSMADPCRRQTASPSLNSLFTAPSTFRIFIFWPNQRERAPAWADQRNANPI